MTMSTVEFTMSSRSQITESEGAGFFLSGDEGRFDGVFSETLSQAMGRQNTRPSGGDSDMSAARETAGVRASETASETVVVTASETVATEERTAGTVIGRSESGNGLFTSVSQWQAVKSSVRSAAVVGNVGDTALPASETGALKLAVAAALTELSELKGSRWLAKLRQFLTAAGVSPGGITVDAQGIEALKGLLVKAGYPEASVE